MGIVAVALLLAAARISASDDVARAAEYDEITQRYVDGAVAARRAMAARVGVAPSPARPFVFLHQRKTGGTTFRGQLRRLAREQALGSWLACYDGVDCRTYEPPRGGLGNASVVGGHLYWPRVAAALPGGFDCLTIFREPVSRVASCWNFRFVQQRGGVAKSPYAPFHAYNASALRSALPGARSRQREGCNNEPFRVLGDFGRRDEDAVSFLTARAGGGDGAPKALDAALAHMQRCVVGVLERCNDTAEALSYFQPWLRGLRHGCEKGRGRVQIGSTPRGTLDDAQRAEVARQNALELRLYRAAGAMLDAQLLVARSQRRDA
jgi:hypothetical protein